jgi:hypothetical protein
MTKIFFDTKSAGLHPNTMLISIGLIAECGKTFYAEFEDYNKSYISDWLQEHVIDNLILSDGEHNASKSQCRTRANTAYIKAVLTAWLNQFEQVEMWGDCLAYDWVLFNHIFGDASNIPEHIYYIPFDICTLLKAKGIEPCINREAFAEMDNADAQKYNALWDAKVIKACYDKLN